MKLNHLLEANITWNNGIVETTLKSFFADNNVTDEQKQKALQIARKSKEYEEFMSIDYEERSGNTQLKNATLAFSPWIRTRSKQEFDFVCFPTGAAKYETMVGSMQTKIKTAEPSQPRDNEAIELTMAKNLVKAMRACLDKRQRAHDAMVKKDVKTKKEGEALNVIKSEFPSGFDITCGWKGQITNFIRKMKDGSYALRNPSVSRSEPTIFTFTIGNQIRKFPVVISSVTSANVEVKFNIIGGDNLSSLEGFPKEVQTLNVRCADPADMIKAIPHHFSNLEWLSFQLDGTLPDVPLLGLLKIKGVKSVRFITLEPAHGSTKKTLLTEIDRLFISYFKEGKDIFDVQEELLEIQEEYGMKNWAKFQ